MVDLVGVEIFKLAILGLLFWKCGNSTEAELCNYSSFIIFDNTLIQNTLFVILVVNLVVVGNFKLAIMGLAGQKWQLY